MQESVKSSKSKMLYGTPNSLHDTTIKMHIYGKDGYICKTVEDISLIKLQDDKALWVQVSGLADKEKISALCELFGVHSLVVEDILKTDQRIKKQPYGDYTHFTTRTLQYDLEKLKISGQQISIIHGQRFLLSFEELPDDYFSSINERLSRASKNINDKLNEGPDFLCYSLLDVIIDDYFLALEMLSLAVESAENDLMHKNEHLTLRRIQNLKRQITRIHRITRPMRDVVDDFIVDRQFKQNDYLSIYTNDLHDNIIQIIDTMDMLKDTLNSIMEIYLSLNSNKMNEIMKVLTVISTIFIPLTFIVGLYGMNLQMPEFGWRMAYPVVLLLMLSIAIIMIIFFKKKKWF